MTTPREDDGRAEGATASAGDETVGDAQGPRVAASDMQEYGTSERADPGLTAPRRSREGASRADVDPLAETARERESPLITAVEIEKFKGIGRPARIDLRPITLLFGRNSAGKSTVLHALCYAHEILSHGNVDAHKTDLGGDQIDLGGFRSATTPYHRRW